MTSTAGATLTQQLRSTRHVWLLRAASLCALLMPLLVYSCSPAGEVTRSLVKVENPLAVSPEDVPRSILEPLELAPSDPPPPTQEPPDQAVTAFPSTTVVSVRDFGAVGDGRTNDSQAIQKANDEVSRRGGGQVQFPPGVYIASGVWQDSFVEFVGTAGAVVKHPDGVSSQPIFRSRTRSTSGRIAKGSNVLAVADRSLAREGALVAVRGAGGASPHQSSNLSTPATMFGSLTVRSTKGFSDGSTYRPNYLLVGSEIISYQRIAANTFLDVRRGLFGTTAKSHPTSTNVAQLRVLYARVTATTPGGVVLDTPAAFGVNYANVWFGSVGLKIDGLTLDGNRKASGAEKTSPFPVLYDLTYGASITRCTMRNADDGAIRFDMGTQQSLIADNVLTNTGSPNLKIGAAVWLFRGSSGNTVRNNEIGGTSYSGVYVDDRTIASTEWDSPGRNNVIEQNRITLPRLDGNDGIGVLGSSDNIVRANVISGAKHGIRIFTGGQGARPPETAENVTESNDLSYHYYGLWVNGTHNRFVQNSFSSVYRDIYDVGRGNQYA